MRRSPSKRPGRVLKAAGEQRARWNVTRLVDQRSRRGQPQPCCSCSRGKPAACASSRRYHTRIHPWSASVERGRSEFQSNPKNQSCRNASASRPQWPRKSRSAPPKPCDAPCHRPNLIPSCRAARQSVPGNS